MHADSLIADVRSDLKQYDTAGLIDDIKMYGLIFSALRQFGNLVTSLHQIYVPIEDGKGVLPSNFSNIKSAIRAEKGWVEGEIPKDELQYIYFWKERNEDSTHWERCEDCHTKRTEKTIVEKIYLHDKEIRFHYRNPRYVKISKHTKKDFISQECQKRQHIFATNYEITINNYTVYSNFSDGSLFIEYYGLELDDEGKPYIPETDRGYLETYLKYYLIRAIFEQLWYNSDDPNVVNKMSHAESKQSEYFAKASSDLKAGTLTFSGLRRLEQNNRRRTSTFEFPLY